MEEKIAGILEDVYKIDSSLREREKDIVRMLEDAIKAEPDFEPDEEFVLELRKEVLKKAEAVQGSKDKGRDAYKKAILIAGVLLVSFLIVILALTSNRFRRSGINIGEVAGISSKVSIAEAGGNAFGVLSDLSGRKNAAENYSSQNSISQDESGSEPAASGSAAGTSSLAIPAGEGSGIYTDSKIAAPYQATYYSYVYKGTKFVQDQEKMNVLKRLTESDSGVSAGDIAQQIGSGLFDFNRLDNSKVSAVSFYEDMDYGYRADVDFVQGQVSLYKNWQKWPSIYADCKDENCYKSSRIKAGDIPADEAIISACDDFLDKYSVDLSAYGKPEIDKRFVNYYAEAAEIIYPEEMTVVYPLQVDGKSVYESYGELFGLNVGFGVRDKKISSVNNLRTNNYQSSAYDAETDVQKILAKAQNIDGNMPLANDGSADFKKVEIELDTPALNYEHFWRYENNGQSSEFLVPCFVFPIKEKAADSGNRWRKNVVVPIIRDFLDGNDGGIAVPATAAAGTDNAVKR